MTNKFKTLLKTSAALATLCAGSQSWGAAAWLDSSTGAAVSTPSVPTAGSITYVLTSGTTASASLAITPEAKGAVKSLNLSMATQGVAPGAVTFTPISDCTINLDCAGTGATDVMILNLGGTGKFKVILNLKSGGYALNAAPGGANLKVTVNILENASIAFGTQQALAWDYNIKKGKTLTATDGGVLTGKVSASGAKIVTGTVSLTIPLK